MTIASVSVQYLNLRALLQDFPFRMSGYPNGMLQYAAFIEAELDEPAELQDLAEWLFKKGKFPGADGVDTELLGMEVAPLNKCA